MIQPQLITLASNLRAAAPDSDKNGEKRLARQESFEDIMNMDRPTVKRPPKFLSGSKPPGLTARADDLAEEPYQPPATEQQAPDNLYILYPPVQLPAAPPDFTGRPLAQAQAQPQIEDAIIAIPEGNHSNILFNKEIVPLIAKLQQALAQMDYSEQPLPPELEEMFQEEVLARMPQIKDITPTPPQADELAGFSVSPRGSSCPPGNVNDEQNLPVAPPAEFLPPAQQTKTASAPFSHSGSEDTAFKQNPPPAAESSAILAEGASFTIEPARLAFGERFNAAAAQALKPLTADNLFAAMIERVVSLPEAEPHMEISLKPEYLGKLTIDLRLSAGGLNAKIIASDENVRNLLAAQVNRLSDSLAERGIRLENVEIIHTALNDAAFGRREPEGQEERENGRSYNSRPGPPDTLPELPIENAYGWPLLANDPYGSLSSVEYRA